MKIGNVSRKSDDGKKIPSVYRVTAGRLPTFVVIKVESSAHWAATGYLPLSTKS